MDIYTSQKKNLTPRNKKHYYHIVDKGSFWHGRFGLATWINSYNDRNHAWVHQSFRLEH